MVWPLSGKTTRSRLEILTVCSARGASVYTLSDDASDAEAAALALRENKSDFIAGLPVSERPVRPHVTLGRARRRRPVPSEVVAGLDVPRARWTAEQVEVVESVLGQGPARYVAHAALPLGGRGV